MRSSLAVLIAVALLFSHPVDACKRHGKYMMAVIIDDLGYSWARGNDIAQLPAPITLSIIPETPHALALAALGERWGKELMVHMPMTSDAQSVRDPLVLTEHLTDDGFDLLIDRALASVPGATGLNNHMGSALTRNADAMTRLMKRLKSQQLFFIDSRTTADSVAAQIARAEGVAQASRTVFLDHDPDRAAVAARLEQAIAAARSMGSAIAIGHPHHATIDVLRQALPRLPSDVTLVPASQIADCDKDQRLTSIP